MPYIPDWFEAKLKSTFGSNLYGEANLKVVFGATEKDYLGRSKYIGSDGKPMECWILTRWQDPKFFADMYGGGEGWEDTRYTYDDIKQKWVDVKGPFPSRGDYVMICPLSNSGEYLALDESVFEAIQRKVKADEEFAEMDITRRTNLSTDVVRQRQAVQEYQHRKTEAETDEYFRTNWDRLSREGTRAWSFDPRSSTPR